MYGFIIGADRRIYSEAGTTILVVVGNDILSFTLQPVCTQITVTNTPQQQVCKFPHFLKGSSILQRAQASGLEKTIEGETGHDF